MEYIPNHWKIFITPNNQKRLKVFFHHLDLIQFTPQKEKVFKSLSLHNLSDIKLVIIGKTPYGISNLATGLAFSVPEGVALTPTLKAIYELLIHSFDDMDFIEESQLSGCLEDWSKEQGVLLLNSSLTTPIGLFKNTNHFAFWEPILKDIVTTISKKGGVCFLLWGRETTKIAKWIDKKNNLVIQTPFPRISSSNFMKSNQFKVANTFLNGTIDWRHMFHIKEK